MKKWSGLPEKSTMQQMEVQRNGVDTQLKPHPGYDPTFPHIVDNNSNVNNSKSGSSNDFTSEGSFEADDSRPNDSLIATENAALHVSALGEAVSNHSHQAISTSIDQDGFDEVNMRNGVRSDVTNGDALDNESDGIASNYKNNETDKVSQESDIDLISVDKNNFLIESSVDAAYSGYNDKGAAFVYRDFSQALESPSLAGKHEIGSYTKSNTFPAKLFDILSRPEFSDMIRWCSHGRSWRVLKPRALESAVLPSYFRHGKYSSFMRQVNGWGFRRLTSHRQDENSYFHELFLRGIPVLCQFMRRKTLPDLSPRDEPNLEAISNARGLPKVTTEQFPNLHSSASDQVSLGTQSIFPAIAPSLTTTLNPTVDSVQQSLSKQLMQPQNGSNFLYFNGSIANSNPFSSAKTDSYFRPAENGYNLMQQVEDNFPIIGQSYNNVQNVPVLQNLSKATTASTRLPDATQIPVQNAIQNFGSITSSNNGLFNDLLFGNCMQEIGQDFSSLAPEMPTYSPKKRHFPSNLFEIISRPEFSNFIGWSDDGKAWRIIEPYSFSAVVLPQYFQHGNLSSFMRNVNAWGFKRICLSDKIKYYTHPLFVRDNASLCKEMRRLRESGGNKDGSG